MRRSNLQRMHRRLELLEDSGAFQLVDPVEQIGKMVLRGMSDRDLEVLKSIALKRSWGQSDRDYSQEEAAVYAKWESATQAVARQLGYKSAEDAERVSEMLPKFGKKRKQSRRI